MSLRSAWATEKVTEHPGLLGKKLLKKSVAGEWKERTRIFIWLFQSVSGILTSSYCKPNLTC